MTIKTPIAIGLAGLVGEVAFEAYAWLVSPSLFGETLEPANLVVGLLKKFVGIEIGYTPAFLIHFIVGALVFSTTVYLLARLLKGRFLVAGLVAGLGLWFTAQGILAPLMGRSFMMDFGTYTQSSFIGHVGMTLIIAVVLKALLATPEGRFTD
ncbi:hypothetical protein N9H93_01675 [Rhizobiaceae bacterium]|nr:hypothetical protein [Rhizobiaceae bacterium]